MSLLVFLLVGIVGSGRWFRFDRRPGGWRNWCLCGWFPVQFTGGFQRRWFVGKHCGGNRRRSGVVDVDSFDQAGLTVA